MDVVWMLAEEMAVHLSVIRTAGIYFSFTPSLMYPAFSVHSKWHGMSFGGIIQQNCRFFIDLGNKSMRDRIILSLRFHKCLHLFML